MDGSYETGSYGESGKHMMEEQVLARTPQQMWQDYLFLTREMGRFLEEESMDMFNELINQREQLQKQLDSVKNQGFHHSSEGKQLIAEIGQLNKKMTFKLRYYVNKAKQQKKIDNAYDGIISNFAPSQVEWRS